jgi:acetolactate synthase-1/2/3 large subunit
MSKGSDLFVAALENEGVERIFGVPGELRDRVSTAGVA